MSEGKRLFQQWLKRCREDVNRPLLCRSCKGKKWANGRACHTCRGRGFEEIQKRK